MARHSTRTGEAGAVVVGGYANGLGVVRSLRARGVRVAVVRTMRQDIAHLSRDTSEHHRLPDFSTRPDSLLELLEHQTARWRGWVVIPTNDLALEVLARERDHLAATYRLPVPPWEVTRRVLDKTLTMRAALEVGIDVPRSFGAAVSGNERLADLEFPVVVKPLRSHEFVERFGKKLLLARNRAELDVAVRDVEHAGLACEVLEVVPGPDHLHITYDVYRTAKGGFVGDWARRKLRQSPPFFGVARAAEPAHVPELREPTYELLRRLEWQGLASVCYKQDPRTGRYYLMEVNGRCPLTNALARRAGVDTPYMIYSGAETGEPLGIRPNGWNGVWIHLHADLLYTALYWRAERLDWNAFWRSYRRPKTFAVWDRDDPKPFFAQWGTTIRKGFRLIFDRGLRQDVFGRVQSMASTGTASKETGSGASGGRDSRGPSGITHLTGDTDPEHRPRVWR